ncbi:MAG: Gfo/Idh/MocA family oxidoreductase [Planctomycetota bacterium]
MTVPVPSELPPTAPLRVGIFGAGRSRQGLGPFLARAFEAAGATVAAVAGRDAAGGVRAAGELAALLGHPVAAAADAMALARAVDALVVAAPVAGHLAGLDAALAAGVPCLCEKPLVAAADLAAGLQRVAAFRARGLLLAENCQWPEVLPTLRALHPAALRTPPRTLAMGLAPAEAGPAMVADSLSHVLSVAQAIADLPPDAQATDVRQSDASPTATRNVVACTLPTRHGPLAVELHLAVGPTQPRPAWLAVDGCRMDRRIGPGYRITFAAPDGREQPCDDPLFRLVYGLRPLLTQPTRERTLAIADDVALRLRLYAGILDGLAGR